MALTLIVSPGLNAQDAPIELNSELLEVIGDIDANLQGELSQIAKDVFNNYADFGTFWDASSNSFSNDKFAEISSLFAGTSRVFNDVEEEPTNINIADYTLNIFEKFQSMPVEFEISNVYLMKLEHEIDQGAYVATIEFDKSMLTGLEKGIATRLKEERNYNRIEMRIEMPEYDVTDTRIIDLLGTVSSGAVKVQKAKSNLAYLGISGFYGINSLSTSPSNSIGENFGDISPSSSVLGLNLGYRKALSTKENLFLVVSFEGRQSTYKSNFGNYAASSNIPLGAQFVNSSTDLNTFNGAGVLENVPANAQISSISTDGGDPIEELKVTGIKVPLGIGIKLAGKPYADMFFLDVLLTPSYSLSSTGTLKATGEGFKVPDDENFPSEQADLDKILTLRPGFFDNDAYNFSVNSEKTVETTSAFSLGVRISPQFYKLIGYRYILTVGAYAEYSILSPIASNPSDQDFTKFFGTGPNENSVTLLEEYFDVKTLNFGIQVGLAYKLGATF
jgi:hypothetical protein